MARIFVKSTRLPPKAAFKVAREFVTQAKGATYSEVRSIYRGARIGFIAFRCKTSQT